MAMEATAAKAGGLTDDEKIELDRLREENAKLKAKVAKGGKLTCKIGEKGGLCVYGLGRFPVTLYREQWERLIAFVPEVQAFIAANAGKLSVKL